MSDPHNTTEFIAARAAGRYLGAQDLPEDEVETIWNWTERPFKPFTDRAAPRGTASPIRGFGYTLLPAVVVTAAAVASLNPGPVSATVNWRAAGHSLLLYDRREEGGRQNETSVADKVTLELAKLPNGWAGEGSVAPSREIIDEVGIVLDVLPKNVAVPSIEVEEEDGSVSLRWVAPQGQRSFSLVFRGTGRVTGVVATINPPRSKAWSAPVSDDVQIALHLDDQLTNGLLAG